ncbi:GmrSD restriction endonuclease domain-containing protein [Mycoplasmopsis bovigenitalium]|nr:DUF262 domain-containing protein [Mycoplasmopsis bovigenitalium]
MSRGIGWWKNSLKNCDIKFWKIGTNINTYIENSVLNWLDKVNIEDVIYGSKHNKSNEQWYYYFSNNDEPFYKENELLHDSTNRQLRDVLTTFLIVKNTNNELRVNEKLISAWEQARNHNNNISKAEVLRKYISDNFLQSVEENLIKKLQNIKNIENDEEIIEKCTPQTKLWWSVLFALDKRIANAENGHGYLNKAFGKIKDKDLLYYDSFIESYLLYKNTNFGANNDLYNKNIENFKKIIEKIKAITEISDSSWKNNDIYRNSLHTNNVETELEEVLNKRAPNNHKFGLVKSNIFDFFKSSSLNYFLPVFQRSYTWDTNIIKGLYESLLHDFEKSNDICTILNNIILGQENLSQIIIDGQQRITSIIIILIALNKYACYRNINYQNNTISLFNSDIWEKIDKLTNNFKKYDFNYDALQYIKSNYSSLDSGESDNSEYNNSRIISNMDEIVQTIEKSLKDWENGHIIDFSEYLLKNTFFIVTYLPNLTLNKSTKIFANINKYSKKLGILDLCRNSLHIILNNSQNARETNDYIDVFNNTINVYFRKSLSINKDDDNDKIVNFLDSLIIFNFDRSKLNKIDSNYDDKVTASIEKFEQIIHHYDQTKNADLNENVISMLIDDILNYEYSRCGSIEKIEEKFAKLSDKNNLNLSNTITKKVKNFKNKISQYKYINFQIFHISKGGSKTVFIPLIWLISRKLQIFEREFSTKNIKKFSLFLAEIEKFSVLWNSSFSGESLTKSIQRICFDLKEKDLETLDAKEIYKDLEKTISSLQNMSEYEKVNNLREELNRILNPDINNESAKKDAKNVLYKTVIGKLANAISLKNRPTPRYFSEYKSSNERTVTFDYLSLSYEHSLPQKPNKEDWKQIIDKTNVEIDEYQNIVHKIGNGCLLSKDDNSKIGNKLHKDYDKYFMDTNNATIKNGESQYKQIDFGKSKKENKLVWSEDKKINLPDIISLPKKLTRDSFNEFKEQIIERSKQIIDSYISVLFYED